jgi:lipopolysaccharide transport system ATP-binding protein
MSTPIVEARGLGKCYRLGGRTGYGRQAFARLSDDLVRALRRPFRRGAGPELIWALRDASFAVDEGEVLGLIGGNGAGKSTLLKVLARVTEPTVGEARLRGRVGSLLEVGTGFHPELSGRENVFMSGAILGMRTAEIKRRFDEIVAFAEVERFLDTPVKHYSSGMFVRLAFAVAAHLEPEILLVDEVLAVGDVAFQQRCLGKLGDVSRSGRTVLFVSHNMAAVEQLCDRAIVLRDGRIDFDGDAPAAVERYLRRNAREDGAVGALRRFSGADGDFGRGLRLVSVGLRAADGERRCSFAPSERVVIEVEYELERPVRDMRLRIWVTTPDEVPVFVVTDHAERSPVEGPGRFVSRCVLPAGLFNTRAYRVEVDAEIPGVELLLARTSCVELFVSGVGNQDTTRAEPWPGLVSPAVTWELGALVASDPADARPDLHPATPVSDPGVPRPSAASAR